MRPNLFITTIVDASTKEKIEVPEEQKQECSQHNWPLCFHCIECKENICEDCIDNDLHCGHKLRSLKYIFNQAREKGIEESKKLQTHQEKLIQEMHRIEESTSMQKEEINRAIGISREKVASILESLETRLKR